MSHNHSPYYLLFYKDTSTGISFLDAPECFNVKCAICHEIYKKAIKTPKFLGKGEPYLEFVMKFHREHLKSCKGHFTIETEQNEKQQN
jgi:hypothetical protein